MLLERNANSVEVLWTEFSADQIPPLDNEAARLRVRLEKFKLLPPFDIERTFAALKAQHVDAVLAIGDQVVYRKRFRVAKSAFKRGLPVPGGSFGVEVGFPDKFRTQPQRCVEKQRRIRR